MSIFRRIIHRDLKPENVVLKVLYFPAKRWYCMYYSVQGEKERTVYKLIDLGYAKELGVSSLAQVRSSASMPELYCVAAEFCWDPAVRGPRAVPGPGLHPLGRLLEPGPAGARDRHRPAALPPQHVAWTGV